MMYESKEINDVIEYIESHLDDELNVEILSKVAGYSPFHFSRMFKSMTGESLAGMIKRLRLEKSAKQLYNISQNITNVGMDSGYNTPSSFTKAFKQRFNISPVDYKTSLQKHFQTAYKKLETEPKIQNYPLKRLLCYRVNGDYTTSAIEAWQNLYQCIEEEKLDVAFDNANYYGLCYDIPGMTDDNKIRYEAAITVHSEFSLHSERLFLRDLPSGIYASLFHQGDQNELYEYWPRFYRWLQSKTLTLAHFAPIERYLDDPAQMLKKMPLKPKTELLILLDK
ncbi:MAG: AraC family transcriptional regulator [Campylobacterales bacterium]|nr:AraC family transcriptional regulator [Campylobacterales bacterium]